MAKISAFLIAVLFTYSSVYWGISKNTIEHKLYQLDSTAYVEFKKDIYEITPNRHPELKKYYASCGLNPEGAYAWCGCFKHYVNTTNGVPGKGAWAAAWVSNPDVLTDSPKMGYGFGIRRNGGSGWHVGQVRRVFDKEEYFTTFEGNISDKLISRKIFTNKPGIKYFTYTKLSNL